MQVSMGVSQKLDGLYIYIMKTDDLGGTTIYGNFHTPIWAYLMFQASIMA